MIRAVRKCFRLIDIFGTSIHMNFDGRENYQSFTGGFCTITIITLIILAFQVLISIEHESQIQVFANKETIYFDTQSDLFPDPIPLELNVKNFLFAVKVEQSNLHPFAQRPYFKVNVIQKTQTLINGTKESLQTSVDLEPCKLEIFNNFSLKLGELYNQFKMEEFLCPTAETVMNLKGSYLSPEFKYLKFSVEQCTNTTNSTTWDVECATQEEKDDYLTIDGYYRLVIYTTNYVVNPTQKENYTTLYLSDDLTFLFQPQSKKYINVFFQQYELNTDYSLIPFPQILSESIIQRTEGSYKIESVYSNIDTDSKVVIYFRSDFIKQRASRKFTKVDTLLSYFGGIFHISYVVAALVFTQYNSMHFKLSMANKLYQYTDQRTRRTNFFFTRNNYLRQQQNNSETGDRQDGLKNKGENLYRYFKDVFLKQKLQMQGGCSYFLYLLTCKRKFINDYNLLVDMTITQVYKDLNIKTMMKQLQEIEKLKSILFTSDQMRVFNFSQKPIISIYNLKRKKSGASTHSISKGQHQFRILVKAYKALLTTEFSNPYEQFMTQNLIKCLGMEMHRILQHGAEIMQKGIEEDQVPDNLPDNINEEVIEFHPETIPEEQKK